MNEKKDIIFMQEAITLAKQAEIEGEVPVGALVTLEGKVIGRGYNQMIQNSDPTSHAEMIALREAALKLNNYRLVNCNLYVTLEPCLMCLGALVHARIGRLVYGADDPKSGAVKSHQELLNSSMLNHKFEVTSGVMRDEASEQISNFFKKKRIKN